mmetsp:Transcript_60680/g.131495  ORF Transcript_60680/g.131495 Transcript_60680/m.131495 type:complete len:158 (-) Transcript_60680:110-583(-)
MAGHAEKKQKAHAEVTIQYYLWAIIAVNVIYFSWRVLLNWGSMGFWNKAGMLLFSGVSYFTYSSIGHSLSLGLDFEYYNDLFLINLVSQAIVSFTDWGWLVYLAVPAFLLHKLIKLLMDYVFTPTAEEAAENDPKNKKKMEKKQKQAERPKLKVTRR